jgi:uncharacterized membrane protein required for colicin V production
VAITVVVSIVIQAVYQRVELSANHPIVDDILGALLGLLEGVVLLVVLVIIMGSVALPPEKSGDLSQFRTVQDMIVNQSHITHWLRDAVAPFVVHILSPLLPPDLKTVFP